ncbi:hypothetical protein SDC9_144955 [bioreactor metagenome]|uniref:Uncharacterized protein n=1 Tax=bioreactor metagenome TaxID=1076179 RepID=A0A645E9H1_9ZZZZ
MIRGAGARFFEIADEGVFQACAAALGHQRRRAVAVEYPPGVHQRDAVAALGLVHEVGGDEDRHPVLAREVDDELPEAIPCHRIDAGGRFVENQHLGPVQYRHRQLQALAYAQRQRVGPGVHHRRQVEAPCQLVDARRALGGGQVEQAGV